MFKVSVTYEGKIKAEDIQRKFRNQLSEKEILKTTAGALNTTAKRAMNVAKREVKKGYTINKKYYDRMANISRYAKGEHSRLYVMTEYHNKPMPLVAFNYTNKNKRDGYHVPGKSYGGVIIEVKKGNKQWLKYAFVKRLKSSHVGIFGLGNYVGRKFVPSTAINKSNKYPVTQLNSLSFHSAFIRKDISGKVQDSVNKNFPTMLQAMLQRKLDKALKG